MKHPLVVIYIVAIALFVALLAGVAIANTQPEYELVATYAPIPLAQQAAISLGVSSTDVEVLTTEGGVVEIRVKKGLPYDTSKLDSDYVSKGYAVTKGSK